MSQDVFVVIEHLKGQVADISYIMMAGAKDLVQYTGGQVVGVLLGHNGEDLAKDLAADRILYLDHPALDEFTPDAYQAALTGLLEGDTPRAVIFGSTTIGADIASTLSVRLNLPLVGLCRTFGPGGTYISQIYGGKMMAEGALPGPAALVTMIPGGYKPEQGYSGQPPPLVTMIPGGYKPEQGYSGQPPPLEAVEVKPFGDLRVTLAGYIEPEAGDVDIANESILIAVGRGIQTEDNIELADELAELLGGTVCASRPVVDQG